MLNSEYALVTCCKAGLTTHQVDPSRDAHLLALLHHLQGLVQENLAGQGVVDDFDISVRQR